MHGQLSNISKLLFLEISDSRPVVGLLAQAVRTEPTASIYLFQYVDASIIGSLPPRSGTGQHTTSR